MTTCCALGALVPDAVQRGQPLLGITSQVYLMIGIWVAILLGGLVNLYAPSFARPKGVLGPLFYKRYGT